MFIPHRPGLSFELNKEVILIFKIIFALLLVLPLKSQAGLIIGAFGGKAFDNGDGIEKLEGTAAGFKTGWRWNWIALEIGQTYYDMKTDKGQAEDYYVNVAQLRGTSTDLMLRFYPWYFLSIGLGVSTLNMKSDILLTNVNGDPTSTIAASGDGYYDAGSIISLGLHLPIGNGFEVYGEIMRRKWESLAPDFVTTKTPDLYLTEGRVGLSWEWGRE